MAMKKKTRATAPRGPKRRKSIMAERKSVPQRAILAPAPRQSVAPNEARITIRRLRTQLARALARIEQLQASADIDFLLDIPNRRGFERELKRAIAYIKRYHASGALIVLDVDRLKPINDAFGHAAGGDELAVLLWNLSETDAKAKAACLEEAVDQLTFMFHGRAVTAGASAGVAILGPHAEAGRALEEADRAMYVRKAQRRHELDAR
jgi:GGDEF domain-containing protein